MKNRRNINERGQVIIILLLLMLVILTIGLAATQRSLNEVSTATQQENSSRAFSAAEAGIEKAIQSQGNVSTTNLGTPGGAVVKTDRFELPAANSTDAIEWPPIGKETIAQFWFANPTTLAATYTESSFDLYFGNTTPAYSASNIKPAVEVTVITLNGANYQSKKYFFDPDNAASRAPANGFTLLTATDCPTAGVTRKTILNQTGDADSVFYCRVNVSGYTGTPIMARVRLLYSNLYQKVGVARRSGATTFFPSQIELYYSTGSSGQTEKKLRVFRVKNYLPPWFDFALFSLNELKK